MVRINIANLQTQESELTAQELANVRGGAKTLPGVKIGGDDDDSNGNGRGRGRGRGLDISISF